MTIPEAFGGIRFGLIGCGLIGSKRASVIVAPHSLVAVHDEQNSRARALASACEITPKVCRTVQDLLNEDLDAVIIATPHNVLIPLTLRSLDAGLHVLCEKPGGINAHEMFAADQRAVELGLALAVGFNHRFHPALQRCFELVSADRFGRFLWIRARYGHGGRPGYENEWRAARAISGGGEMVDQGSHLIDLVRFLVGDVELEYSKLQTMFWRMNVEDNAFFALSPHVGGFAWLHSSWTEWKNMFSLEVTLETAKIEITGLGGSYGTEKLVLHEMRPELGPPDTSEISWSGSDASWSMEVDDFIRKIRGQSSQGATMRDAAEVRLVIEKAYSK